MAASIEKLSKDQMGRRLSALVGKLKAQKERGTLMLSAASEYGGGAASGAIRALMGNERGDVFIPGTELDWLTIGVPLAQAVVLWKPKSSLARHVVSPLLGGMGAHSLGNLVFKTLRT